MHQQQGAAQQSLLPQVSMSGTLNLPPPFFFPLLILYLPFSATLFRRR